MSRHGLRSTLCIVTSRCRAINGLLLCAPDQEPQHERHVTVTEGSSSWHSAALPGTCGFSPLVNVHPPHEEPQQQRYFPGASEREVVGIQIVCERLPQKRQVTTSGKHAQRANDPRQKG